MFLLAALIKVATKFPWIICETKIMTKDDEIPDWVGAQEFYEKYDPKEILGR